MPFGNFGELRGMAYAVSFPASPEVRHITGGIPAIDGACLPIRSNTFS